MSCSRKFHTYSAELLQLPYWHSLNLKFISQGRHYHFCPFSLYFSHFRRFNLVPAQKPHVCSRGPNTHTAEVSQQKLVQKHSHQHTFSWFQSVLDKSGNAELGNYADKLRNNNIHHTKWVSPSHMFRCTFFTKLFLGHITYLKYKHFFLALTCLSVAESKYT